MPVAVRLVEFLTIITLFILVSTGAFLLYFADKIICFVAIVLTPITELIQLIMLSLEYFFYWSTRHLFGLLFSIGTCGIVIPTDG